MSTHYDIHCRTCDESAGFEVRSAFVEQLTQLIRRVDLWKQLAGVVGDDTDIEMRMLGGDCAVDHFPRFAEKHAGHDLAIRTEYGDFLDRKDCGYQIKCPSCHHMLVCTRESTHAGEHLLIPFMSVGVKEG